MTRLTPDFYEVLNIPFTNTSTPLSKQQLKLAYHKALLKHHPDKAPATTVTATATTTTNTAHTDSPNPKTTFPSPPSYDGDSVRLNGSFTVDEITTAYRTLLDPSLRAEYDRSLRLDRARVADREKTGTVFHTGLEVVDLEDLDCEEDGVEVFWYRGCRCGDEKGFLVTEQDLEKEAEHGEIVVGCRGCSLWMKVLFAVQDDDGAALAPAAAADDGDLAGRKT